MIFIVAIGSALSIWKAMLAGDFHSAFHIWLDLWRDDPEAAGMACGFIYAPILLPVFWIAQRLATAKKRLKTSAN
jgi:hypothetical protein